MLPSVRVLDALSTTVCMYNGIVFHFGLEEEGDLDLGLGKLISRRTLLAAAKRYEKALILPIYLVLQSW